MLYYVSGKVALLEPGLAVIDCGGVAKVPFQPKTDRPVYCSECFAQMRANG